MNIKYIAVLISCFTGVILTIYACFVDYKITGFFGWLAGLFIKTTAKKTVERIKTAKIVKSKKTLATRYTQLIHNLISDMSLNMTVEGFNALALIGGVLFVIMANIMIKDILLSSLISASFLVAIIAFLFSRARIENEVKISHIMDAEDLLCAKVRDGVENAIRSVMETGGYIDRSIVQHFEDFINDIDNTGYSFREAMERLNIRLGPSFNEFARKAVIFEANERKGMADIFLDIVNSNNHKRQINIEKSNMFNIITTNYIYIVFIVAGFIGFTFADSYTRQLMLNTFIGKALLAAALIGMLLGYARIQALQSK